ncbi:hypothetical protein D0T12_14965 [Actinomadura spongiicola]|uniref:Type I restriction modification DNA specificity domain-containing protein n=2 Tax=Actinomadura spongiicola TaxID=2303421 RepID=A0A372GI73_9ACTN|nr:hypothetical protein D0T12_14965 [Actinomadura spongiicola]
MTEGGDLDKLGRGTLWQNELDGCLHQNHVFALRPFPGKLDPRYLALATQSAYARHYFESTGVKTTNLASTNRIKILGFPVPLPPLKEQRRIADFLDIETARIDELIQLDYSLKARLEEREKSYRDFMIDGMAGEFGEIPLRRLVQKIEQGASPQCEGSARQGRDEWAVLKLSAVKRGHFLSDENKRLPVEVAPEVRYEVKAGDLLVTRANTPELVGDVAVVTGSAEKLLLPDLIYRVRLKSGVESEFVSQVLRSNRVRSLIEASARGSSQSMVKLRGEDIKEWPVPLVEQAMQRACMEELRRRSAEIWDLRQKVDRRVALLEERRRAVVTAAVTGELDVTTARSFGSA